jgi:hypothetical protein
LSENDKDELFANSIQSYIEYPKELKRKGKKIAMNIISHSWRIYKNRLVMCCWNKTIPFNTYKELREEDWERFVANCKSEDFVANNLYMQ